MKNGEGKEQMWTLNGLVDDIWLFPWVADGSVSIFGKETGLYPLFRLGYAGWALDTSGSPLSSRGRDTTIFNKQ